MLFSFDWQQCLKTIKNWWWRVSKVRKKSKKRRSSRQTSITRWRERRLSDIFLHHVSWENHIDACFVRRVFSNSAEEQRRVNVNADWSWKCRRARLLRLLKYRWDKSYSRWWRCRADPFVLLDRWDATMRSLLSEIRYKDVLHLLFLTLLMAWEIKERLSTGATQTDKFWKANMNSHQCPLNIIPSLSWTIFVASTALTCTVEDSSCN